MSSIKVMVAFGQQTFDLINSEAKERGVTVQELLRAVIIPDWFRTHGELLTKITMPEARTRIEPLTKPEPGLDQAPSSTPIGYTWSDTTPPPAQPPPSSTRQAPSGPC